MKVYIDVQLARHPILFNLPEIRLTILQDAGLARTTVALRVEVGQAHRYAAISPLLPTFRPEEGALC